MDFQERLKKAIERGQRAGNRRAEAEAQRADTEQELHRRYIENRLELSERIEEALRQLADNFPGFQLETIVDTRGWGAAISRNDIEIRAGSRGTFFSHLELVVRPLTDSHILELAGKATVRNRELFRRSHYQRLGEVDLTSFLNVLDLWALEFAELYAAQA
jgi:hypothetical protein